MPSRSRSCSWPAAAPACRRRGAGAGRRPGGEATGRRALVEALADRFGPIEREPAFDALRPKLARAALVPSRVFDDATAWTSRGDGWRAVELAGYASRAAPTASACAARRLRRRRRASTAAACGSSGWTAGASSGRSRRSWRSAASGRPTSRRRSTRLFRGGGGLERGRGPGRDRGGASRGPRRRLGPPRSASRRWRCSGTPTARRPCASRCGSPRTASAASPLATPPSSRSTRRRSGRRLVVADPGGAAWWSLEAADNLWTVRLRVRDGSLVPLDGTGRPPPPLAPARHGRLRDADGAVRGGRDAASRPTWRSRGRPARRALGPLPRRSRTGSCPSSRSLLLGGPLRYPFEAPGSEVALGGAGDARRRRRVLVAPLPRPCARDLDPALARRDDQHRGGRVPHAAPRPRPTASTGSACSPCGTTSPPSRRREGEPRGRGVVLA